MRESFMEIKTKRIQLLAALFIFFCIPYGITQTIEQQNSLNETIPPILEDEQETQKNYFVKQEGANSVFYQRLSWESLDNILYFIFILEHHNAQGAWAQIDKKTITTNFIEVSLSPGKYRYKIIAVNLLGQEESISEYRNFNILIAHQPEVHSLSPRTIYFDEEHTDYLEITGKEFYETTDYLLVNTAWGTRLIKGTIADISADKTQAKIGFKIDRLAPGEYVLIARDASGLTDQSKTLTLKFQKPVDTYLSLGYPFTVFIGNSVFKEFFNRTFTPFGLLLRLTCMPIKRTYGSYGFNLTSSGLYIKGEGADYTLSGYFLIPHLNFTYIYPIKRRKVNFDIHGGIGALFLLHTKFQYPEVSSPKFWYWGVSADFGTAFQFYMYKRLYFEINVDHIFPFRKGFPIYIVQPSVSVGWEF